MIFFCSGISVMLLDTQGSLGITICCVCRVQISDSQIIHDLFVCIDFLMG